MRPGCGARALTLGAPLLTTRAMMTRWKQAAQVVAARLTPSRRRGSAEAVRALLPLLGARWLGPLHHLVVARRAASRRSRLPQQTRPAHTLRLLSQRQRQSSAGLCPVPTLPHCLDQGPLMPRHRCAEARHRPPVLGPCSTRRSWLRRLRRDLTPPRAMPTARTSQPEFVQTLQAGATRTPVRG